MEKERARYQAEYDSYMRSLQELDIKRAELIQAINERRGILVFLASLNQNKEGI